MTQVDAFFAIQTAPPSTKMRTALSFSDLFSAVDCAGHEARKRFGAAFQTINTRIIQGKYAVDHLNGYIFYAQLVYHPTRRKRLVQETIPIH